jgi:ArsR family transcriptional regulator, arsenate/arsenite/antimonite-responsive transcriptional repressor / arsenate reductase (thioredoxin)
MILEAYSHAVTPADDVTERAAIHAALGEPMRLAIVDDLLTTDRSPGELSEFFGLPTNLLAHHLQVLESVGLIVRVTSSGDRRRRYIRLQRERLASVRLARATRVTGAVFLCTHNSARSQLAAALWTARTGQPATSAGTRPAERVHRGAVAAGRRVGLDLTAAVPRQVDRNDLDRVDTRVVTVCDNAHESLVPGTTWWHWSIPDPVESGRPSTFDAVVADLDTRISAIVAAADISPTPLPTPLTTPLPTSRTSGAHTS